MAKRYDVTLDRYQVQSILGAVRAKHDVIVLWMRAIKVFLTNQPAPDGLREAQLSIVVQSMSRLFCEMRDGKKIFSVAFPFSIRVADGELRFLSREGVLIDNRVSSQILALVESDETSVLRARDFEGFIDPIIEATDVDPELWTLLRELMLAEDGYVRYDCDEERADGHLHPTHHLDLGYSASGTFKIGLKDAIDQTGLTDILDLETDCHYLTPTNASLGASWK